MNKIIFFLLITSLSVAQNSNRKFVKHEIRKEVLEVSVSDGTYHIQLIPEGVQTSFIPKGEKYDSNSHAFISLKKAEGTVVDEQEKLLFSYQDFKVEIVKNPFQIRYHYQGKELLSEKLGYFKQKHAVLEKVKGNIIADSTEVIQFNLSSDEKLYGGGARVLGMNRRGTKLALYNRADYGYETRSELMNYTLPIVISSKKYMVHFDNAPVGYLDLDSKKNNVLAYETISGRKTYQVIVGEHWDNLVSNYTALTGRQPLPARWVFGNFASRFGYHSEAETRKTIQKYQDEKIPVDAVILDLYWFGKDIQGTMGNLEVFRDSFPTFEKMVADFTKMGIKTITVTEPFILTSSKKWEEVKTKKVVATNADGSPATWDFYFGNTGLVDVFKPEGKVWFWDIYKELANKGVSGIWGDLGEPEVFPSSATTFAGTADEVHNIYGHQWAKLIHEGYRNDFPKVRPFILMRAGAAGSQRYGMIPWSGDVNRSWGGLSGQVEIALQMGMQGLAYMHSDLGGFAGANLDDELYVRWLQYGVFNPIFRPHAQEDVPSEPVFRSDWAKKLAKQAIELRYQMLPYNYNVAFENSQTGKPLMRPLFFEEADNESLLTKSDGYLWGNDFLIYPIMEAGQKTKAVYFPKGSSWIDFYTHQSYVGGTTQTFKIVENHIPTFVRAGSIIPMSKPIQNTTAYSNDGLEFHYYYDENSIDEKKQSFYFDDGITAHNYENDTYFTLAFETEKEGKWLEIEVEKEIAANYKSTTLETYTLVIHQLAKKPRKVKVNGKTINFVFDEQSKTARFNLTAFNEETEIKIKL
jgi:oligosaccharide 4-alpha-D-glucosyltransferase